MKICLDKCACYIRGYIQQNSSNNTLKICLFQTMQLYLKRFVTEPQKIFSKNLGLR